MSAYLRIFVRTFSPGQLQYKANQMMMFLFRAMPSERQCVSVLLRLQYWVCFADVLKIK